MLLSYTVYLQYYVQTALASQYLRIDPASFVRTICVAL
jgi:hypothetical protein